jgi:hypothetical protein
MKITLITLAATTTIAFSQGPLAPSAAPAPTMKTLAQVEARTPIPATTTPGAGPHFIISTPGSYYLTGNITVTTGDAIAINTSGVTLDLNGFTLRSTLTEGAAGKGIDLADHNRIRISNGSIVSSTAVSATGDYTLAGFNYGIYALAGNFRQISIENVSITGVAVDGINLDKQGNIDRCSAHRCGAGGLEARIVTGSSARFCQFSGITAITATHSEGESKVSKGIDCENASNCEGTSDSGIGLFCVNADNCSGSSTSNAGISCTNATNSSGNSSASIGLKATGTASFSRGRGPNVAAIDAAIAIGCTSSGGAIISPQKHLGTP